MSAPLPIRTPLVRYGGNCGRWRSIALKDETRQISGAFKYRSNFAKLSTLPAGSAVCTASTGNHGFGLSIAARGRGMRATVFVPNNTPERKLENIRATGAEIRLIDGTYEACSAAARLYGCESGATYVPSFDDRDIIDAHRRMLDEIDDDAPLAGAVFVPVGGGGLLAAAMLQWGGRRRVVGVEHVDGAVMRESLRTRQRVRIECGGFPEGLMVPEVGRIPFDICMQTQPEMVCVDTAVIHDAMTLLWTVLGIRAEGAGAAAFAAALTDSAANGGDCICIVSGGNVDDDAFASIVGEGKAS